MTDALLLFPALFLQDHKPALDQIQLFKSQTVSGLSQFLHRRGKMYIMERCAALHQCIALADSLRQYLGDIRLHLEKLLHNFAEKLLIKPVCCCIDG